MAQDARARVRQVLVFGSILQGAILVHWFEPIGFRRHVGMLIANIKIP